MVVVAAAAPRGGTLISGIYTNMTKARKMTKATFVEELSKGKSILGICKEFGYVGTATIYKWRRKDERFDQTVTRILESPVHVERLRNNGKKPERKTDTWIDIYFAELRAKKDRVRAADLAGKTITFIMNACNTEHEDFCQEFADRQYEENARDALQIEDEVKKKALLENSLNTQKFLLPYLPVVGESYKKVGGRLEEKHQNVFIFSKEGMEGASTMLQGMFGKEVKEIS